MDHRPIGRDASGGRQPRFSVDRVEHVVPADCVDGHQQYADYAAGREPLASHRDSRSPSTPRARYNQGTILVGDGSLAQNTLATVPSDIIFDRVYVHGQPNVDMRKCIALDAARASVIDSYHQRMPFDVRRASDRRHERPRPIQDREQLPRGVWPRTSTSGGADPGIVGLVPADIEIRRNHIFKPLAWKGTQWVEKNLIESKNSTRVLVEGNVLENSWVNGQVGYTLALWSVNQTAAVRGARPVIGPSETT